MLNWIQIKTALHSAALKVDSGMTLREFSIFSQEVKNQLSHSYLGDGHLCTICNEDFDYEFHS